MGCRNVLKTARMAINKWISPRESRAGAKEERSSGCSATGDSGEMFRQGRSSNPGWKHPPGSGHPEGFLDKSCAHSAAER